MKKRSKNRSRKNKKGGKFIKRFFILAVWGFVLVGAVLLWHAKDLPNIEDVETASKRPSIVFLSSDHQEIAVDGDVAGEIVTLKQVPKSLVHALLATEDRHFYKHFGVDWIGLLRATVKNIVAGRFIQGGSTLTQQLAKNLFLSPERSINRKIKELLLAFWLEYHFTKDQILTIYLNRVYLGRQTYGVDAAAQQYFGKLVSHLSLEESAVIVGLLKAPSRYGSNEGQLRKRASIVLMRMQELGYLTLERYKASLKKLETLRFVLSKRDNNVRYFTDWVASEASKYVDKKTDLIIITTLDRKLQSIASQFLQKQISLYGEERRIGEASFVAMNYNGAVKAIVGGANYNRNQFNVAVQARRQPGSSFKPVIYLAAMEAGYNPDDVILSDDSYKNKNWTVENYGWQMRGSATMRDALIYSLNTSTVRLAQMVGMKKIMEVSQKLGFQTSIERNLSIALGTSSSNLLELTRMMAIIANHGKKIEPYGILEIRSTNGEILYKRPEPVEAPEQLFEPHIIKELAIILEEVVTRGTGKKAAIPNVRVGGKTGTSQDYRDAWFIGYTSDLIAGVWMGNLNYQPMNHVVGGTLPAQTWKMIVESYQTDISTEEERAA